MTEEAIVTNVGTVNRAVRLVIGAILFAAPFLPPLAGRLAGWGAWKFARPAAGVVMLTTALFRFCPAYALLGIRTCPLHKS
jgi:hypothetical protein